MHWKTYPLCPFLVSFSWHAPHVLSKFFYRGDFNVQAELFSIKKFPPAPFSPATSSSSGLLPVPPREDGPLTLSSPQTGYSLSWKKAGGGPNIFLDKSCPFTSLQLLSENTTKNSLAVYGVSPFLTALGSAQKVMMGERLTILPPSHNSNPVTSLFFALAVEVIL